MIVAAARCEQSLMSRSGKGENHWLITSSSDHQPGTVRVRAEGSDSPLCPVARSLSLYLRPVAAKFLSSIKCVLQDGMLGVPTYLERI